MKSSPHTHTPVPTGMTKKSAKETTAGKNHVIDEGLVDDMMKNKIINHLLGG